jgi:alanyl-tRNA synthetase
MTDKEEKADPIDFDVEKVTDLLSVLVETKGFPALLALNQAAQINLAITAAEVQKELDERAEELRKKGEEEAAKKAKEAAEEKKKSEAHETHQPERRF